MIRISVFVINLSFLQLIYNGEGNVLKWIVITDGNLLTHDMIQHLEIDVLLLRSEDGGLSSTMIKNAMICIKRYKQLPRCIQLGICIQL